MTVNTTPQIIPDPGSWNMEHGTMSITNKEQGYITLALTENSY
jgi:hypothetical protein